MGGGDDDSSWAATAARPVLAIHSTTTFHQSMPGADQRLDGAVVQPVHSDDRIANYLFLRFVLEAKLLLEVRRVPQSYMCCQAMAIANRDCVQRVERLLRRLFFELTRDDEIFSRETRAKLKILDWKQPYNSAVACLRGHALVCCPYNQSARADRRVPVCLSLSCRCQYMRETIISQVLQLHGTFRWIGI